MSADVARRRQAIRDGQFVRVIESEPGFNKWEIPFNAVKPYMSTLVIILQTEWLYQTSKSSNAIPNTSKAGHARRFICSNYAYYISLGAFIFVNSI